VFDITKFSEIHNVCELNSSKTVYKDWFGTNTLAYFVFAPITSKNVCSICPFCSFTNIPGKLARVFDITKFYEIYNVCELNIPKDSLERLVWDKLASFVASITRTNVYNICPFYSFPNASRK
jgi:hypothetical protein